MIPATFDYAAPESLDEAIALLAKHGDDAKVLTGGHSLIPMMRLRLAQPAVLVDLRKIQALDGICPEDGWMYIGARTTHANVASNAAIRKKLALFAETAGEVGDRQVRNVGTIGGSVIHADPAADWPAAFLAAGAKLVLVGPSGERTVEADDFFVGLLESAAKPGEILTQIRVPVADNAHGAYRKMAQSASGFALAGVAAQLTVEGGKVATARIGVTGVGEAAFRATKVEDALVGCATGDPGALEAACNDAAAGIETLEDIHASGDYRAHLASVLARRAVVAAAARANA